MRKVWTTVFMVAVLFFGSFSLSFAAAVPAARSSGLERVIGYTPQGTEIVFIDSSVIEQERIVDDLLENAQVFRLTPGVDGVEEISAYLAGRVNLHAVRIISHGSAGHFILNGKRIDEEFLRDHGARIAAWGRALSRDGDILIYGCNLAANGEGKTLVKQMARITGADIAGSTNLTGAWGDWELEYQHGTIETDALNIRDYPFHLANQVVTNNNDSGAGSLRQAIADVGSGEEITFNLSSGNETISLSSELSMVFWPAKSVTIDGDNAAGSGVDVTVQVASPGISSFRVFNIRPATGATVTIKNMTIKGGDVSGQGPGDRDGGAIYADWYGGLTLENCTISGSKATRGGAIYIYHLDGNVTITNCTIEDCEAKEVSDFGGTGGGIYIRDCTVAMESSTLNNNSATGTGNIIQGGGIYSYNNTFAIDKCTISNNTSADNSGGGMSDNGGSTLTITNSTIHGNAATNDNGGGILQTMGSLEMTNCTIFNNTCKWWGGGIYCGATSTTMTNVTIANNNATDQTADGLCLSGAGNTLYIKNSLLANNDTYDFYFFSGTVTNNGYNLVEAQDDAIFADGVNGCIVGNQANLNLSGTLADNGTLNGTQTLALSAGSVAINAGNNTANNGVAIPTTDQRGAARSAATDMGAYEFDGDLGALSISDLSDFASTEQDPAAIIDSDVGLFGGTSYSDGYLKFTLSGATSWDQLVLSSDPDPNANNAISVSGSDVYLGNGSDKDRIGSIDSTENGQNGQALKILFSSPLTNAGFETGDTSGWTTYEQDYGMGFDGDAIYYSYGGGPTTGWGTIDMGTDNGMSFNIEVQTSEKSSGTYALRLYSSGNITFTNPPQSGQQPDGYGSFHGPYVLSSEFTAEDGDQLYVDWAAKNGGDWYEVFGYLVGAGEDGTFGTDDDTRTKLFSQRGDTQTWNTTNENIASAGTYKFEFICGTYDASGGKYVGASLYVDNIRVVSSSTVNDSVVSNIARHVTFQNTSDDPPTAARTFTVEAEANDGSTGSANATITITPVNDPPTVGTNATLTVDEGGSGTIATSNLNESDPDDSGTGLTYTLSPTPNNGTVYLSGGALEENNTFTQDDIDNNRVTYTHDGSETTSDSFGFSLADGGEDGVSPATDTFSINVNAKDDAPVMTTSGGTSSFVEDEGGIVVDSDLTVTDADGGTIDGAKISISSGFVSGEDSLSFTSQHGVTGSFNSTTGVLSLSGDASAAQYQEVLRSVTYSNSSQNPNTGNRTITFSLGASTLYCPDTGHFYEFVTSSSITWTNAETAAEGRSLYGLQGYLATVTSAEENTFVAGKLAGQGWMGASDAASENTWRWVTGPEGTEDGGAGRHFFTQIGTGGSAVNGEYNNWASGEPNDWASSEDYAHFYVSGTWNDYAYDNSSIQGYVVEYGGQSGEPTLLLEGSKTVTVGASDDAPTVANPISDVTVDEDAPNTTIDVTDVFTDVDDDDAAIVKTVQSNSNTGLVSASINGNTLTLDYQEDQNGTATIVIRGTSNGKTADDTFIVTVDAENDAPTVDDQTFNIDENSANTTVVDTVAASDVDSPSLTYDIKGGNTNAAFAINTSNGEITVNDSTQLDYEITPSYSLDVEVSDGALADTATVTINVNNLIDTYATVTTTAPFNITATTASGGGNVTATGDSPVTARGICWSTSENPTADLPTRTTNGSGTGAYSSSMAGLDPNTTYHVRAYATNSMGSSYGDDLTFTTEKTIPTVTTTEPSAITGTTALCGGDVTSDGGAAVTARGVCWNTTGNPTTADDHTVDGTGTGAYSTTITGLQPNTTYDVRAYATNSEGTAYGGAWTFTTNASTTAPLFMLLLDGTAQEEDEGQQ